MPQNSLSVENFPKRKILIGVQPGVWGSATEDSSIAGLYSSFFITSGRLAACSNWLGPQARIPKQRFKPCMHISAPIKWLVPEQVAHFSGLRPLAEICARLAEICARLAGRIFARKSPKWLKSSKIIKSAQASFWLSWISSNSSRR